jgi:hypothetical protein
MNPLLSTSYLRKKAFHDFAQPMEPMEFVLNEEDPLKSKVLMFDIQELILRKLSNIGETFPNFSQYLVECIPHYARTLKQKYENVVTSFLDSPSHER